MDTNGYKWIQMDTNGYRNEMDTGMKWIQE
jgi:hypothetical protein